MKHLELLKSLLLTLIVALPQIASAYDFMVDGLCYNYNSDGTSVTVTYETASSPRYSNLSGELNIPENVTYNGTSYSVTLIGGNAFTGCTGLTSVSIGNSVTEIGEEAFYGCNNLTSVTIPNSVTSISEYTFINCSGLTSMVVESGNPKYDSRNNCNAIIETATNTLISGCKNTIIPNSVTSIGNYAFYGCTGLTSVTIPNSVTEIGEGAFGWCENLTSVTIGNSVTSIGAYAFSYCTGLTSVTWNANNCSYFSESKAPFKWLTGITSFVFGNEVEHIPAYLCYGCSGLTSVTIPNSVTSIGSMAFRSCSGLTSVEIPNSVASIGGGAFMGCSGLTSVTVGNSVETIGSYAFNHCSGLTSVYSKIKNPETVSYESYIFYKVPTSQCLLYVPKGKLEIYSTTWPWSSFSNIIEMAPDGDVNDDGHVNSVDVTVLYNYLLSGDSEFLVNGDLDGDGHITSVDITAVYNLLLGN